MHSGPSELAKLACKVFPWHSDEDMHQFLRISFVGPKKVADWCLKILELPAGPLHVDTSAVLWWLGLLKVVHPMYSGIEMPDEADLIGYLTRIKEGIYAKAQIVTGKVSSCLDSAVGCDIAGVRTLEPDKLKEDYEDDVEDFDDVPDADCDNDIEQRNKAVEIGDDAFARKIILVLDDALVVEGASSKDSGFIGAAILHSLNKLINPAEARENATNRELNVEAERAEKPVDEISEGDLYLYGAFPCIFVFGRVNINVIYWLLFNNSLMFCIR
jgi:hypothetical protein